MVVRQFVVSDTSAASRLSCQNSGRAVKALLEHTVARLLSGKLMILRIVPSVAERAAGSLGNETIEKALRNFRSDGALIIEDVVDAPLIAEARRAFSNRYSQYLDDSEHEDALRVGGRRLLITINLEPPFDTPKLFANPYFLPVLNAALD